MPAERAGYTVTMFLVDVSPSMSKMRQVEVPGSSGNEPEITEMTNLEWSLQYIKLQIQEMIFNGRKTDKCGVILFGSEETKNIVSEAGGGYEHVAEYIPIAQPNSTTLAKLAALKPSSVSGDPVDALIVAIETQDRFLGNKKTWTRKIVILTDGESPIEVEDWEATVKKMNALDISLLIVGVDFDDDELPFHEENKSNIKKENEGFYHTFTSKLHAGVVGNCDYALQEIHRPDVRPVKSTLMGTVLRIGDTQVRPEEAIEISIKTSKCTALARPKSWKRFGRRKKPVEKGEDKDTNQDAMDDEEEEEEDIMWFAQLRMRTRYYCEKDKDGKDSTKQEDRILESPTVGDGHGNKTNKRNDTKKPEPDPGTEIPKEELVRGYKYGATFLPISDGGFPRLRTRKGMDICGFFQKKNFRREFEMGEVYYVWADPGDPAQQVALSSIVQAMYEKGVMAISRWVSKDDMDPKMGVLYPAVLKEVDCLMWVQMPFADDIRNFPFASLETLINKKGEVVTEHPYLPTNEQMDAMEQFVDAMNLSDAGDKDDNGNREPWFDTRLSYNPAIHRTKQALFHSAIVPDLITHPLSPPHPELLKYLEPPQRVLKRARTAIEECQRTLNVREVPKKVARVRQEERVRVPDDDEEMLLLDQKGSPSSKKQTQARSQRTSQTQPQIQAQSQSQIQPKASAMDVDSSETEEEPEEEELLLGKDTPARNFEDGAPLPTPARSESPDLIIDQHKMPGRSVGMSFPLKDFKKIVARGGTVTKAVNDLAWVIQDILKRPFSSRRYDELIECLQELRAVAMKENEIVTWNTFIQELRETCLETKPGNKLFWDKVREIGRPLSFISSAEASKVGSESAMSESEAQKFIQK